MVVMILLCGAVTAQPVQMIESHLGNEGPAFQEGMTPGTIGWGPDDRAYPDRFVVYRDGSEMVWVPPGSFPMGSTDEQVEELLRHRSGPIRDSLKFFYDAETPQRRVEMDGYWVAMHAVTNAQYRAFCEVTGREFPEDSDQGDDHPVVYVSWYDAVAYAEHYGLRLPTEAQWEYAARGPEGHAYPWGDEWDPERLCWREHQGPGGETFPVGSFAQSASWVGALDMAGNVMEWCANWYDPNYYKTAPSSNPSGPAEGVSFQVPVIGEGRDARVLRGGCWMGDGGDCRAANRYPYIPVMAGYDSGFRVATN
jgi:formylglycine-generating enzyme required for sulfatase activity